MVVEDVDVLFLIRGHALIEDAHAVGLVLRGEGSRRPSSIQVSGDPDGAVLAFRHSGRSGGSGGRNREGSQHGCCGNAA